MLFLILIFSRITAAAAADTSAASAAINIFPH